MYTHTHTCRYLYVCVYIYTHIHTYSIKRHFRDNLSLQPNVFYGPSKNPQAISSKTQIIIDSPACRSVSKSEAELERMKNYFQADRLGSREACRSCSTP